MTEDMRVDKTTKILTLDKAKKDETESGNQTLTTYATYIKTTKNKCIKK